MSITLAHIPIYWRTLEKHTGAMKAAFQREQAARRAQCTMLGSDVAVADEIAKRYTWANDWYPWFYNDAVGWIEVSVAQGSLHFEAWVRPNSHGRSKGKDFERAGDAKVWLRVPKNNAEVLASIRETLEDFVRTSFRKSYHIPWQETMEFFRFVDWKKLEEWRPSGR